jgi:hypothetical protein
MKDIDYVKLSEQYASFLVAVGGVSITALAVVLSLTHELTKEEAGSFLVLALVAATVCCFIGAHMMAETAAFISYAKITFEYKTQPREIPAAGEPLGKRLFLLASTNIFIAIALVLFGLTLLPAASNLPDAASIRLISFLIFVAVLAGASYWMCLAAVHRMEGSWGAILPAGIVGAAWAFFLYLFQSHKNWVLGLTFVPIVLISVILLIYFASIFKNSHRVPAREVGPGDIRFFTIAITLSYASLLVAAVRTMFFIK